MKTKTLCRVRVSNILANKHIIIVHLVGSGYIRLNSIDTVCRFISASGARVVMAEPVNLFTITEFFKDDANCVKKGLNS